MESAGQRGNTIAEAVVVVAILTIAAGALANAALAATRAAAGDPVSATLQQTVSRELAIARDVLKYEGASVAPATVVTTAPLPVGSPVPIQLSIARAVNADGSLHISVTAEAADGSGKSASVDAAMGAAALLPGTRVIAPGSAPAPTGAP